MKKKTITLVGGSGFLAKYCISELLKSGHRLRILCRNPHLAGKIRMMGSPDQLDIVKGDISSKYQLKQCIDGSDIVINFVGILFERGNQTFEKCHSMGPKNIAEICVEYQIKQFIHFSSIGADKNSDSKYQVSKAFGEEKIREILPSATIIRPSIVFGPGDGFFTVQSKLVKSLPIVPLFSNNKYQCVYVADIATAIIKIIEAVDSQGKIFEFGGPDIFTLKEIYQLILKSLNIKRLILPVPLSIANFAALVMKPLPNPLITFDQVKLLKKDNIITSDEHTLESLGIQPKSARDIVPTYL